MGDLCSTPFAGLPRHKFVVSYLKSVPRHRCTLDSLGLTRKAPGESYDMCEESRRATVHFRLTLAGRGRLRHPVTGTVEPLEPGDVFMITPGYTARWWAPPDSTWDLLWANISGDAAVDLAEGIVRQHGHVVRIPLDSGPFRLLGGLYVSALEQRLPDDYLLSASIYQFLMEFQSVLAGRRATVPAAVREAARIVRERYADPALDVARVAAEAGCSRTHLSRQFKEVCNIGLRQYLVDVRIERALWLIHETDLPIETVARQTGFSDASYFGKVFRRRVGSTPTTVRRQHTHLPLSTVLVHGAPRIEEMT